MTPYHNIASVPPPLGHWIEVFWWGENRWITARWDGEHWRDTLARIVQGPVLYWRQRQQQ